MLPIMLITGGIITYLNYITKTTPNEVRFMHFLAKIMIILGLKPIIASDCNSYSSIEHSQSIAAINSLRHSIKPTPWDMPTIVWNSSLYNAVNNYLNVVGQDWVFRNNTGCPVFPGYAHEMAGACLTKQPGLEAFKSCQLVNHDTSIDAAHITTVIKFRVAEKLCFNYWACDKEHSSGYKSCNFAPPVLTGKCKDFWPYVGNFVRDEFESMAIVPLDSRGPYAPPNQPCSFWIYGCGANLKVPVNDVPYKQRLRLRNLGV